MLKSSQAFHDLVGESNFPSTATELGYFEEKNILLEYRDHEEIGLESRSYRRTRAFQGRSYTLYPAIVIREAKQAAKTIDYSGSGSIWFG